MRDQGTILRNRRQGQAGGSDQGDGGRATPALVIGSGKGGVGKSVIAAAMAATVAAAGWRVLLVDGDQNLGNLHVMLGLRPALTPEAMLDCGVDVADLVVEAGAGLWVVPADSGTDSLYSLTPSDRARLHARLTSLYPDFDLVIIDAGAGLDSAVRCAALCATGLIVTTLPEPASLTDAYALIKIVNHELSGLPIDVLINRCRDTAEASSAWQRLEEAANRFLSRRIDYLGAIWEDPDFRERSRKAGVLLRPESEGPALGAVHALTIERIIPRLQESRATTHP